MVRDELVLHPSFTGLERTANASSQQSPMLRQIAANTPRARRRTRPWVFEAPRFLISKHRRANNSLGRVGPPDPSLMQSLCRAGFSLETSNDRFRRLADIRGLRRRGRGWGKGTFAPFICTDHRLKFRARNFGANQKPIAGTYLFTAVYGFERVEHDRLYLAAYRQRT